MINLSAPVNSVMMNETDAFDLKWERALKIAKECLVTVSLNGDRKGMGVLLGHDVLLIPKHLILEEGCSSRGQEFIRLINLIEIEGERLRANVTAISDGEKNLDFCLLKLSQSFKGPFPSFCQLPPEECLFAEIDENGVTTTIAKPCNQDFQRLRGKEFGWSRPGSSGGIYLNSAGQLIGIHLGQASGDYPSENGDERHMLLIKDIISTSSFSSEEISFSPSTCLSPIQKNVSFVNQRDIRNETGIDSEGYFCESREIHESNAKRGIQIDIKRRVKNSKTNKFQNDKINSLRYQIFIIEGNIQKPNFHEGKGTPSSYNKTTAQDFYAFVTTYFHKKVLRSNNQNEWHFEYRKFPFVAKRYEVNFS